MSLDEGYEHEVGERGGGLSRDTGTGSLVPGGAGSRILVVDEATASVDSRTEALPSNAPRDSWKIASTIVIAHRLPNRAPADLILVVDGEVKVEWGTWSRSCWRPVWLLPTPCEAVLRPAPPEVRPVVRGQTRTPALPATHSVKPGGRCVRMLVQVLGSGCEKCNDLHDNATQRWSHVIHSWRRRAESRRRRRVHPLWGWVNRWYLRRGGLHRAGAHSRRSSGRHGKACRSWLMRSTSTLSQGFWARVRPLS